MKYMIASDIHGSAFYCEKMFAAFEQSNAEKLLLLGDLLYHGPRNELPRDYNPKEVIALLNRYRERIYAVRGNCDAEVDQMVLDVPIMADYAVFVMDGISIYVTHGHLIDGKLPPMQQSDILLQGHTHVPKAEMLEGIMHLNPGSVALPKEGNPPTYALLEEGLFTIYTFEGTAIKQIKLGGK